jgi:large subunit ribosomal protein LP0
MADRKKAYMNSFMNCCQEYSKILVVQADNVGSKQFQQVRKALRGTAVVVMGKNTMMKKAIKLLGDKNEKVQNLSPYLKGNVGLVFTNAELSSIKDIIISNKVAAPARQGAISPVKVVVPAGPTTLEPTKTSFFQALSIPTKITKGFVDIINEYVLLQPGQKVGNSEAALLQMLNILPFFYGLKISHVYDNGNVFNADVLDISDDVMATAFTEGITNVASVSLETGIPTEASVPHLVAAGFKNLLAIAAATDVEFEQAKELKKFLADPSAFAVAAPVVAAPTATTTTTSAPAKKEPEPKSESESEGDMGFGLFG